MSAPAPLAGTTLAPPVLLEGPKGTELQRLGRPVTRPWWTSEALLHDEGREQLRAVHGAYREAGAALVTANTFRTNVRALRRAGADEELSRTLVRRAVDDARAAAGDGASGTRRVPVAACVTTADDCYRPDLTPPDDVLAAEHGWLVDRLAEEKADLVLAETMNTAREAVVVTDLCRRAGLPVWVSFVCREGGRLLSGEDLGEAARAVAAAGAGAVLVNCVALADLDAALDALAAARPGPIGAYPNLEDRSGIEEWTPVNRYVPVACPPQEFADLMAGRIERYGLDIVGGCCGTTPAHVAALHGRLAPDGLSGGAPS
ncbi:homocysteine S-methyltransferase family protein [Streptomyces sp. TRM 70351]|uniref:homocysteine S-methyltransferase family protein n=1 Tax=Streptomyces sp. TRM 70351 TaxID=3116552 RepID=UPI002E7B3518|nr:homocysteine S-methyltransferase family protein [Streptomyces sp. TRM 70351]MEE1930146.1 homocysteine S-methyltransferase family protein [Streptomyces sp. TRM 70351]